jgi:hypothetical protein
MVAAFALAWFVPSIQDAIVSRAIVGQVTKADAAAAFKDDALHVLLCGTGSPMLDPKRANACTTIIAGGHVVVIDAGPGAWAKLAQAMVPAAQVDTVLLTHLHSDHLGDLGEVAVQSWIGGRKVPLEVYGPPAPDAYALPQDAEGDTFGKSGTEDVVRGFPKPTTPTRHSASCITTLLTCRRRAHDRAQFAEARRRRGRYRLRQRRAQDRGLSRQPRPGGAGSWLPHHV